MPDYQKQEIHFDFGFDFPAIKDWRFEMFIYKYSIPIDLCMKYIKIIHVIYFIIDNQ